MFVTKRKYNQLEEDVKDIQRELSTSQKHISKLRDKMEALEKEFGIEKDISKYTLFMYNMQYPNIKTYYKLTKWRKFLDFLKIEYKEETKADYIKRK